jgi:hypothetical protein
VCPYVARENFSASGDSTKITRNFDSSSYSRDSSVGKVTASRLEAGVRFPAWGGKNSQIKCTFICRFTFSEFSKKGK